MRWSTRGAAGILTEKAKFDLKHLNGSYLHIKITLHWENYERLAKAGCGYNESYIVQIQIQHSND